MCCRRQSAVHRDGHRCRRRCHHLRGHRRPTVPHSTAPPGCFLAQGRAGHLHPSPDPQPTDGFALGQHGRVHRCHQQHSHTLPPRPPPCLPVRAAVAAAPARLAGSGRVVLALEFSGPAPCAGCHRTAKPTTSQPPPGLVGGRYTGIPAASPRLRHQPDAAPPAWPATPCQHEPPR